MADIGVWEIKDDGTPGRLARVEIPREQHLEDWIFSNPDLLEAGLSIIGRQVIVDGGRLDLLAVDPQGQWVVIEIKRDMLYRSVVAQALDYAACIAQMSPDALRGRLADGVDIPDAPRDVRVFVVGTGEDASLGRVVDYLTGRYAVPISVVSFRAHALARGQQVLIRELSDSELSVAAPGRAAPNASDVALQFESGALGAELKALYDSAVRHGLYPRAFPSCIMFTPPSMRNRTLLTVWTTPQAKGQVWIGSTVFAKFYPVDDTEVTARLGEEGWRQIAPGDAEKLAQALDGLFATIDQRRASEDRG